MSCQRSAVQNHEDIKFFENMTVLKYLGRTITNQNSIHEEIKSRLNSGSAVYCVVQNHVFLTAI
jgi:hypothetical protein